PSTRASRASSLELGDLPFGRRPPESRRDPPPLQAVNPFRGLPRHIARVVVRVSVYGDATGRRRRHAAPANQRHTAAAEGNGSSDLASLTRPVRHGHERPHQSTLQGVSVASTATRLELTPATGHVARLRLPEAAGSRDGGLAQGKNMSSNKQSTATKKRRTADSPAPNSDGATATAGDLHGVVAEMKSQLNSLQQWKLSAEARLLQLEAQNEMLARRLEEETIQRGLDITTSVSSAARDIEARHDKLKQQCIFLDEKCTALEETLVDDVLRDPDWEYPEPCPGIDFEELGFDDYNPYLDIRDATTDLRHLSLGHLGPNIAIGCVGDPVLINSDEMAPHWKQLAKAIHLRYPMGQIGASGGGDPTRYVSFANVQIPHSVQSDIARALALKNFRKLTLINNHLGGDQRFIRHILANNASLKELVWDRNVIADARFGHLIQEYNVFESIKIERSCRDSAVGMSLLRSILNASLCNTNLTRIDMESNYIETSGDAFLFDYISKNAPLRYLCLKGNRLNDHDALQIAQALKKNCNLIELNLEDNLITNDGYNTIRRAIWADDLSFNELYHCNHVCQFKPIADIEAHADTNGLRNNTMSMVRRATATSMARARTRDNLSAKIVYDFKNKISTDSLVSSLQMEFGDASLKLTPYILRAIHYYYTVHPISISFEKRVLDTLYGMLRVWVIVRNCTDNAKSKEAQKNSFGALNKRGYYILLWQGSDPPHWD
ncbi:hypothetical protein THAOC_26683, partial [Thalassiosira oceanica]